MSRWLLRQRHYHHAWQPEFNPCTHVRKRTDGTSCPPAYTCHIARMHTHTEWQIAYPHICTVFLVVWRLCYRQDRLTSLTLLLSPPTCWDYRHTPHLTYRNHWKFSSTVEKLIKRLCFFHIKDHDRRLLCSMRIIQIFAFYKPCLHEKRCSGNKYRLFSI